MTCTDQAGQHSCPFWSSSPACLVSLKQAVHCRYAAASFLGSLASLGLPKIEALGGPKLVRPLMWLLRHGDASCKFAAVRALMFLADEPACRHVMSSVRLQAALRGPLG